MLERVLTASIRHPLLVVLVWLGIALAGVLGFARLELDAFPDTTPVQVQVNAAAPALSPLEAERTVTSPIEQVLAGLPGLVEVRSLTRFGLTQVTATFRDDTDLWLARQVVAERLALAEVAPGVDGPRLGPVSTGLGEVFHYLVTGEGHTLADLRAAQDYRLAPQLRAVAGVAEVNSWGGDERQFQVVVEPAALLGHGVTLGQIAAAIAANNGNAAGGVLDEAGQARVIQALGVVRGPEDLGGIVIASHDGTPVKVADVGRVVEGREIRHGGVTAQGRGEAVLGLGFLLAGENSRDVARGLRARLDEARTTLPEGIEAEVVYDRALLVDRVLATVKRNLLEGAVLVVAVLFAFLGSLRAGLLVALAIPLSMLFAFDLMARVGIAGSLMSLGAIDFGLLVDSSVIQVENTMRRLAAALPGQDRLEVVREAAIEVRRPTLFGELVILAVYLPVLTLEGIEGKLFRPMALTVVFALVGSALISITLVPALASRVLPPRPRTGDTWLLARLRRLYRPLLHLALRHRGVVVGLALLLVGNGAYLATRLGGEFVPRLMEGTIVVNTVRLASVSIEESLRYGTRIEQLLLAGFPDEIERVWTRTGSAEVATDPMGPELSDVFVTLTPRPRWRKARTQEDLVERMREALAALPGMRAIFTQPIEMRVGEMTAGIRSDLGVKVFGDDFEVLRTVARDVERVLADIPGAADVVTETLTGLPVLEIEIDREALARNGVAAATVLEAVTALGGLVVGEARDGERRVPVAVRLDPGAARDVEAISRLVVMAEGGRRFELRDLARIRAVEGPALIQREWAKRRVVVQANSRGRDIASFVAEARARLAREVALPDGVYLRFGGQFEHLERASRRLAVVVPLALVIVLVLLYLTYGRWVDAARVFTGVPFAAVGGVAALWLRGMPFSVSAGVGFVALSGVAVLGDMVLVSTVRRLVGTGMAVERAIEEAAETRLRPVLMTGLVASLGFVPMALSQGLGAEVQRPLATVVVGGVISSTMLTLVVLPALYSLTASWGSGGAAARAAWDRQA